jgi:hypothetical protein
MREENEYRNHEYMRISFRWGTYGKSGNEPLRWISLDEISDDHLKNIIQHLWDNGEGLSPTMALMITETVYRDDRGIKIIEIPNPKDFKFGR